MRFVLWFAAVVTLLLVLITDGFSSQGGDTTFVLLVKSSLGKTLPKCYGPSCMGKLVSMHVWIRTAPLSYGDAELWVNGVLYHALVWRIRVDSTWYLWAWQGNNMWFRAAKWYADQHPADTVGPGTWRSIATLGSAQCTAVAGAGMIPVRSDAGTLIPPAPLQQQVCAEAGAVAPSDAGPGQDACHIVNVPQSWPDGGVVTCSGSGYWLARNRHGGTWGTDPVPQALPAAADAGAPPVGYQQDEDWSTPDAATTKTCWGVPVGAECP